MTATDAEREAIFQAVLDEPGEDLHRLAYADHLEQYGDDLDVSHAHFIRAQIRHPVEAACEYAIRGSAPRGERTELLGWLIDHEATRRLLVNLMHGFPMTDCLLTFRRGFLAEIHALLDVLLHSGADVVKAHPVEKMGATNKQPLALDTGAYGDPWKGWFCWGDDAVIMDGEEAAGVPFEGDVPRRVLRAMKGGRRIESNPYNVYFPSREEAVLSLHDATLSVCREEAARVKA